MPADPARRGVTFFVPGVPVAQGSMSAFVNRKTGRAIVVQGGDKQRRDSLLSWRFLVASAARDGGCVALDGPIAIDMTFRLPAPAARKTNTEKQRARWAHPWRKPDLDKLERAVLDALTGVAYRDDAQVCRVFKSKIYVSSIQTAPGLVVTLEELGDES